MDDKREFLGMPIVVNPDVPPNEIWIGVDLASTGDVTVSYKLNTATGEISDMRRVLHPRDKS